MARKFLTNIDLNLNQLLNAIAQVLGSDPGGPTEGQFWYNSATKTFKFRNDATTLVLGKLNEITAPAADVSLNSNKITNLTAGTADTDAANVGQVNAAARGMDWKASVRAATTANGTLASAYENGDTIDGVTLATGDRILLKDQTTGADNGIYVVAASGAPTRATDADASAEVTAGLTVWVEEGTANGDKSFTLTTNNPITLGSTSLTFAQSGAAPSSAGSVTKYATSIGNGSSTSFTVTHSLGSLDVTVEVYTNSDGTKVEPDITHATTNTLTVDFAVAPTSNQYRVVCIG